MLRKHQIEGAEWLLAHPHGYLADAPRVGKTRTLLEAVGRSNTANALIIVPAMVRSHWQREAAEMGITLSYPIISYERALTLSKEGWFEQRPDILILDEAHFLKNPVSKRTKALFGRNGIARQVDTVWPASGTPIPKNPGEIYPLLSALHPDLLRANGLTTLEKFRERFVSGYTLMLHGRPVFKATGGRNLDELKELLAPIMLRRTLADLGPDVPILDWQQVELNSGDPIGHVPNVLNYVVGSQTSDTAEVRHIIGDLKAPLAADMVLQQIVSDWSQKIAVFAYHRSVLDTIRHKLMAAGIAVEYIDGDTLVAFRDQAIDRFQNWDAPRVFLGQSKACEVGIRLDAADLAIIVEPSWTAADNVQLANRIVDANRPGRRCVVQMVSLGGTIDDAVVAQNRRESEQAAKLFGV